MLLDHLGLPEAPRTVFERPPLALAICQVRFAPILSVADPVQVAPFQRAVQATYPILNSSTQIKLQIGVASNQAGLRHGPAEPRWEFTDQERNWTVVLTTEFVALETRAYQEFDDFLDRLRHVLEALEEAFQLTVGTRIGLRYINEVRVGSLELSSIINRDLLGPLSVPGFSDNIDQTLQELILSYPSGEGISMRHGRIPGGTTVQPREGEKIHEEPFYLLDIDIYREFRQPSLLTEPQVVCEHVDVFHQAIWRLFRWAITNDFAASLGERTHDTR